MVIGTGRGRRMFSSGAAAAGGSLPRSHRASLWRVLQADAAVAEVALFLGEQFLLGRVVEIYPVAVRQVELELAQELAGPGRWRT